MAVGSTFDVLACMLHSFGLERQAVTRFLPPDEAKQLKAAFSVKVDPSVLLPPPGSVLRRVHYSWILTALQSMNEDLRQLFLQALPEDLSHTAARLLRTPYFSGKLSQSVSQFLLQQLAQKMGLADALPLDFIPPGDLNVLLKLQKRQMAQLLGYLGLHDLSNELRQVVEQATLSQIERLLTPAQSIYLRQAMRHADPWKVASVGMNQWARDRSHCYRLLQMRGLLRLGKVLASASPLLTWTLTHRLDTGRGRLLTVFATKRTTTVLEKHLMGQLLRLVDQMIQRDTHD